MTSPGPEFVIVGAGLTGGAAATTLRTDGFDGRIVMIGEEPHPPYERPPLSKEYLRGDATAESTLLRPASWYEENEVELHLGARARVVDPEARTVVLDDDSQIRYDRVLVATGGRHRRPALPGGDLEGIHYLRTIEESDAIREEARAGRKAVVVGAGFIGCEVAASFRQLGVEVEMVEILGAPLERGVGPEIGRLFADIHRSRGVTLHLGQGVERFEGTGRLEAVVTDRGNRIECDFVVVGVGIEPNLGVIEGTSVEIDDGILVDELCRTNVEGIYAAGDVANHWHPIFERRLRVEHWDNALKQGAAAARSMMGRKEPFDDPHWFWSDQYDQNLQSIGVVSDRDELVVRGSLEESSFVAFYLRDGLLRGAVGLNRGRDVRRCGPLIRSRRPLDPDALRDEDVDLKRLAASVKEGASSDPADR
jgi:3-phenylpropionate/trans-cinnamate dioxygenase ferredoxin reductase component